MSEKSSFTRGVLEPVTNYGIREFSFERLDVWKMAIQLVKRVYQATENYPVEERFGLTSQTRRASTSTPANIAEGTSRRTNKDKIHFLNMAFSSMLELVNHLVVGKELGYLEDQVYVDLRLRIQQITALLHGLSRSFQKDE